VTRGVWRGSPVLIVFSADASTGLQDHLLAREILGRYVARQLQRQQGSSAARPIGCSSSLARACWRPTRWRASRTPRSVTGSACCSSSNGSRTRRASSCSGQVVTRRSSSSRSAQPPRRRTEGCRVSGVGVQVRGQWLHHHSRLEHRVVDEHDRRVRPEHEPRRELRAGPRLVRYEGNEQVQTARHERGWRDRTSTQYSSSQGRVHEFVLEPDEFKRIPEGAALVINGDEVTLTFCDPKIRRLPVTVPFP